MPSTRKFSVQWTQTAADDLEPIIDYVADESISSAVHVFQKLRARAARPTSFPQRGRVVPELKAHGMLTYRELIERPWRILYRIEADTVYVLAVIDARRNVEDLLLDRFVRQPPETS